MAGIDATNYNKIAELYNKNSSAIEGTFNSNAGKININFNTNNSSKPDVVSKEKYTYKDNDGTLIKYSDGTCVFQAADKNNVVHQLKFNSEKDLQKNQPSTEIINPGNLGKQKTITMKYHKNGQLLEREIKDLFGRVYSHEDYNEDGKVAERKVYDIENGQLSKDIKFEYDKKNNTRSARVYDNDNKLVQTVLTKYDGDKAVEQEARYPDGALQYEAKFDNNGKVHTKTEYYENGRIKAETEYYENGVIKTQNRYDENGEITGTISDEIDGNFGNSAQKSEGDCYLLASINAIRELDNGQKILSDLVTVSKNANGEKIYTVTLPGAKIAAEGLKTDPNYDPHKVYITGTYTFTESEMKEILEQAGKKYSLGDGDVILLEAAFEKYRDEVNKTNKSNGIQMNNSNSSLAGIWTGQDVDNILAGGQPYDAMFILTGQKSTLYSNNAAPNGLSYKAAQNGELVVIPKKRDNGLSTSKAPAPEIDGAITHTQSDLDKKLDEIMNDSKDGKTDIAATATFTMVDDNGKVKSGHAFTIKSVDKDTVTLINPWHPDQELTMTREAFMGSVNNLSLTQVLSTNNTGSTHVNQNVINTITTVLHNTNNTNTGSTHVNQNVINTITNVLQNTNNTNTDSTITLSPNILKIINELFGKDKLMKLAEMINNDTLSAASPENFGLSTEEFRQLLQFISNNSAIYK